ncbi:hypothetical protein [uncultured Clostridium sp.]|jgi:fructosamine-3-kinase|uniref:hypothetical protein n=1 Tax=uncultured Clostridium sp. TaxID=59620 RepID=UPI00262316D7|nr:hypothetical protein [uncultured Clostridium sp.]
MEKGIVLGAMEIVQRKVNKAEHRLNWIREQMQEQGIEEENIDKWFDELEENITDIRYQAEEIEEKLSEE